MWGIALATKGASLMEGFGSWSQGSKMPLKRWRCNAIDQNKSRFANIAERVVWGGYGMRKRICAPEQSSFCLKNPEKGRYRIGVWAVQVCLPRGSCKGAAMIQGEWVFKMPKEDYIACDAKGRWWWPRGQTKSTPWGEATRWKNCREVKRKSINATRRT